MWGSGRRDSALSSSVPSFPLFLLKGTAEPLLLWNIQGPPQFTTERDRDRDRENRKRQRRRERERERERESLEKPWPESIFAKVKATSPFLFCFFFFFSESLQNSGKCLMAFCTQEDSETSQFCQSPGLCAFNTDLLALGVGISLVRHPVATKEHIVQLQAELLGQECKGNNVWLRDQ